MKKTLIAIAVGGAFLAPPAMAEVTLSGVINVGPVVGKSNDGTAAGPTNDITGVNPAQPKGVSGASLHSTYSHVDVQSIEDIGGNNKIDFHLQLDLSGTSGALPQTTAVRNRNSSIGVMGDWGALRWGANENVYERYMYQADPLDGSAAIGGNLNLLGTPGAGQVFESGINNGQALTCTPTGAPGGGIAAAYTPTAGCVGFYRRSENTIWYRSPDLSGLSFEVDFSLPAYKKVGAAGTMINSQIWSVGVQYAPVNMPFTVDIAYERHKDLFGLQLIAGNVNTTASNGSRDTGLQIGASYTLGDFTFNLRAEQLRYTLDGVGLGDVNKYKRNAYWGAVKWNVPTGYFGAEYGRAQSGSCERVGAGCNASKTGAQLLSGGYVHTLSKQTQAMLFVSYMRNDDFGTYVNIGSNTGIGQKGVSLYLGLKHSF